MYLISLVKRKKIKWAIAIVLIVIGLSRCVGVYLYITSHIAFSGKEPAIKLNIDDYETELTAKKDPDSIEFSFGDLSLNVTSKNLIGTSCNYEKEEYKNSLITFKYVNYDLQVFSANFLRNSMCSIGGEGADILLNQILDPYYVLGLQTYTYSYMGYWLQSEIANLRPLSLKQTFFESNSDLLIYAKKLKIRNVLFPGKKTYLLETDKFRVLISGLFHIPPQYTPTKTIKNFISGDLYVIYLFDRTDSLSHLICFKPKYDIVSDEEVLRHIIDILAGFEYKDTELTLDKFEQWDKEFADSVEKLKDSGFPPNKHYIFYNAPERSELKLFCIRLNHNTKKQ